MKMTRKLIPAIAMLLISAVMMSTASFAWFSMNTSVSASGMQIQAKSASKYLQIVAGEDAFDNTAAQTTATAKKASNILRPTALVDAITGEGTGFTPYSGGTDLVWIEAFSDAPNVSDKGAKKTYIDVSTAATATEGTSNVYTLYNIFKVRMNPTTGVDTATDLAITNVKVTSNGTTGAENLLPAVRVAIIGPDGGAIYDHTGTLIENRGSATIASTVTTTASTIKVFVFFDGEDAAATTNNVVDAAAYSVEFTLGIQ